MRCKRITARNGQSLRPGAKGERGSGWGGEAARLSAGAAVAAARGASARVPGRSSEPGRRQRRTTCKEGEGGEAPRQGRAFPHRTWHHAAPAPIKGGSGPPPALPPGSSHADPGGCSAKLCGGGGGCAACSPRGDSSCRRHLLIFNSQGSARGQPAPLTPFCSLCALGSLQRRASPSATGRRKPSVRWGPSGRFRGQEPSAQ